MSDNQFSTQNPDPIGDFLEVADGSESSLFNDLPFAPQEEPVLEQQPMTAQPQPQHAVQSPAGQLQMQPISQQAVQPVQQMQFEQPQQQSELGQSQQQTILPAQQSNPQQTIRPAAPAQPQQPPLDPFAAALQQAQQKSEARLADSFAEREPIFTYGKASDPISDKEITFEGLREQYESDFPELADSKKVSWSVMYGKVTKNILNPGSDKVYDLKTEIEKSKSFLDNIKKAKTDAEKEPKCLVKPFVRAQSKGEARIPSYKDYCLSLDDAEKSQKPIIILPSRDGRIYEMRKTEVGTFTAPAEFLPEFPPVTQEFQMSLPKIPMHILMFILDFFRELSDRCELEALVHILYDNLRCKYVIRVPKQKLTHVSVNSVMDEAYPEHFIHVMDIHSHNTMPAQFSQTDDDDERATRLYGVVGRFDRVLPEITVRASCGGKFIAVEPSDIFESKLSGYSYPKTWDEQIIIPPEPKKKPVFALPHKLSELLLKGGCYDEVF